MQIFTQFNGTSTVEVNICLQSNTSGLFSKMNSLNFAWKFSWGGEIDKRETKAQKYFCFCHLNNANWRNNSHSEFFTSGTRKKKSNLPSSFTLTKEFFIAHSFFSHFSIEIVSFIVSFVVIASNWAANTPHWHKPVILNVKIISPISLSVSLGSVTFHSNEHEIFYIRSSESNAEIFFLHVLINSLRIRELNNSAVARVHPGVDFFAYS